MSNWDDEDWDDSGLVAATTNPGGNWDDEDAEPEPEPELKKPSSAMKPKKALELALKAKEDAQRERERERILEREKQLSEMSDVQRKLEDQRIVEEADLDNVKDLFSGDAAAGAAAAAANEAEPTIESFKPVSAADFTALAKMVGDRCGKLNDNPRKTGQYVEFVKAVMRHLLTDLGPDDANDLSMFMGVLSNEKREEFKKAKGIKKRNNKKAIIRVDKASDLRDGNFDDFADDFM